MGSPGTAASRSSAPVLCLSRTVWAAWCYLLLPTASVTSSHPRLESLVSDLDTPFPPTSQIQMAPSHFSIEWVEAGQNSWKARESFCQHVVLSSWAFQSGGWFWWTVFGVLKWLVGLCLYPSQNHWYSMGVKLLVQDLARMLEALRGRVVYLENNQLRSSAHGKMVQPPEMMVGSERWVPI